MQKLDVAYSAPTHGGNNFTEVAPGDVIHPDDKIVILPEWDQLVEPVRGVADFDFLRSVPPILVNAQDGKLAIIDGRKRFLACKATHRRVSFITEHFSRKRAKDEFLRHHRLRK